MAIFGFSAFDQSAQARGGTGPQTAGPLTPAHSNEWAILANVNATGGGGVNTPGFTSLFSDQVSIAVMPVPTTAPVSISNAIGPGAWSTNLLLFNGTSYALTATVSSVTMLGGTLTFVTSAPQSFVVGTQVTFIGLSGASFLNGQTVKILTNSGTTITAAFSHADYGPTGDSGTATNLPYLQMASIDNPVSAPVALALPNPVTAGSTILVCVCSSDANATWVVTTITDNQGNSYTIQNAGGFTFGYVNLAWAQLAAGGSTTVTMNGTTFSGPLSMRYVIFELPEGAFSFAISGNAGIAGATLNLTGDTTESTTADGSGNYTFPGLVNGNYVVTPVLGAITFTPTNRSETVSNANITGVDFTVGDEVAVAEIQIEITYQNPGNFLYARDVNSWGDGGTFGGNNGTPYSQCFVTIGSIELAQLGAPGFPLQHIVGYFDAAGALNSGGPSDPNIFILPNEVSDTAGIGFIELPEVEFEPPIGQTHSSKTILARRWPVNMMNSYLASQFIHHIQVKISWEPENAPNTIKAIAFKEEQS